MKWMFVLIVCLFVVVLDRKKDLSKMKSLLNILTDPNIR